MHSPCEPLQIIDFDETTAVILAARYHAEGLILFSHVVRCGYVPDAFTLEGAYCKTSCGIPVAVARGQEKRQKKVESYVAVAVESSSKEAMEIWILGQRGSGIGLYITTRPISGSLAWRPRPRRGVKDKQICENGQTRGRASG